ncbi:MAG TPA: 3-deoxy-8-phosphooctulonate synthase [Bacteroidota bacterium]|nr:3-deoxy-8-phosphooctulonate synthase [Bacteroidota bacterium]
MIKVGTIPVGGGSPLVLIAGPCVVEEREMILRTAARIRNAAVAAGIPVIFKSSYKKANRTSGTSFRGLGMDDALGILDEVRREIGIPVLTDVHSGPEVAAAAQAVDVLQIPAFLCRQTELLEAAGKSGKPVNVKKGQFMAPEDMKHQAEKISRTGNRNIMLTERGTSFGYHNLVVDMRSLVIMRETGYPVILDVTHSLQLPGGNEQSSGGQPEYIFPLARAGVAVGIDGVFIETHPDPPNAMSDSATQLDLKLLGPLLKQVRAVDTAMRNNLDPKTR